MKPEKLDLYAWIGEDEFKAGSIGLKQGLVPAGLIPMVSVSKEKLDKYWQQAEDQARIYGRRIYLAKFSLVEILEETKSVETIHQ